MKSSVVVVGLVCVAGAFVVLSSNPVTGSEPRTQEVAIILPESLDDFYPPENPAPAYLLAMLELDRSFSGMVADALEGDLPNARANFDAFKELYVKTAEMIPEWKTAYAMEPVEALGQAIASGDPGHIMPAVDAVGHTCHSCHLQSMVPVQQKYHWERFSDLTLIDPLSGRDVSFAQLMQMLETNFTGIGNNLQQGQPENARMQFEGFQQRFQAMSEACMMCHDTERKYFVSEDIADLITSLKDVLGQEAADMPKFGGLMKAIANESCEKCHLVHLPAAYSQFVTRPH